MQGPDAETGGRPAEPLRSEYVHDADMVEPVQFFLAELEERVSSMMRAWQRGDRELLRRIALQLKGAGGGYGFPAITDAAARLERSLLVPESDLADLTEQVEVLILLCRRASAAR